MVGDCRPSPNGAATGSIRLRRRARAIMERVTNARPNAALQSGQFDAQPRLFERRGASIWRLAANAEDRGDWVDDLAAAARADRTFPKNGDPEAVRAYLRKQQADGDTFQRCCQSNANRSPHDPVRYLSAIV
jgi:hypothetical protein